MEAWHHQKQHGALALDWLCSCCVHAGVEGSVARGTCARTPSEWAHACTHGCEHVCMGVYGCVCARAHA
eukprot:scaffold252046_cov32-Tisochrysis_lutea.AAC.1